MYCASCGSLVPDGAAFCPECGAPAPTAAPAATMQAVPAPGSQNVWNGANAHELRPQPAATPEPTRPTYTYDAQTPAAPNMTAPAHTPVANAQPMPSTGVALALIVVGFLCGIIWGVFGITQYGPMKNAIAVGDAETANRKFRNIMWATIAGVVLNLILMLL